jgi:hypothetical protein
MSLQYRKYFRSPKKLKLPHTFPNIPQSRRFVFFYGAFHSDDAFYKLREFFLGLQGFEVLEEGGLFFSWLGL